MIRLPPRDSAAPMLTVGQPLQMNGDVFLLTGPNVAAPVRREVQPVCPTILPFLVKNTRIVSKPRVTKNLSE